MPDPGMRRSRRVPLAMGLRLSFIAVWAATASAGSGESAAVGSRGEITATKLASVSGTVTAEAGGRGVRGVTVWLLHLNGMLAEQTRTRADGSYSLEVTPGTYYLRVFSEAGLFGGLFDGIPCPFACDGRIGTPITASGRVTGVDFAMKASGSLSGRVIDAATSEPLALVTILVFDHTGQRQLQASTLTDQAGRYRVPGLPAGTFYVGSQRNSGYDFGQFDPHAYLDRLHGGPPCYQGRCNALAGTPLVVRLGEETAGVDLALTRGGSVSGTVLDEETGEPVAGTRVAVRDARGTTLTEGESDAEGRYTASGLLAGEYYVLALAAADHPGELYDGAPCSPAVCDLSLGTLVGVALDTDTAGVDFTVRRARGRGGLSGRVTEKGGGQAVAGIEVIVLDHRARGLATTRSGADGSYRFDDLPAGDVYLRTFNLLGYFDEIYDGRACSVFCNVQEGSPVAVVGGAETTDVDFELVRGGVISGDVTDGAGKPLRAEVTAYREEQGSVRFAAVGDSDAAGRFHLRPLAAGSYFVFARAFERRFGELFDDLPCYPSACDFAAGSPVPVELGVETGNVDFVLQRGAALSGRVVDETTGKDLPFSYEVLAFDEKGHFVVSEFVSGGRYTLSGLIPGSYFVRTSNLAGFVDEVHAGVDCAPVRCDVTAGTPVTVDAAGETARVDFALARGGTISGAVTEVSTGLPIRGGVGIQVADAAGATVAFDSSVESDGSYKISGLPEGTYFVSTLSASTLGQIYAGVPCILGCDVTSGTPVDVVPGRDTRGVDFTLALGGRFSGNITGRETGEEVRDARMDVFLSDGTPAFSTVVLPAGRQAAGSRASYNVGALPEGTYFVRVSAPGFAGVLYDGVPCPGECDVTAGTAVEVRVNEVTSGIDFELDAAGDP